jgi:superfamily II DNA or RNA helicase
MIKSFTPIPGTIGHISENGIELVITGGDFSAVKKACTVINKGAVYQARQAEKALNRFTDRYEQAVDDFGVDSVEVEKLAEIVADKEKELAAFKDQIKKEYWADRDDGFLSLPAGFWWMCEEIEGEKHLNSEVLYQKIPAINGKTPRPYQEEVCKALLQFKRASCVMPTGTGKSLMIAMMAWSFVSVGKRVCIIEPTIELVDQTLGFLKNYFDSITGVGGGKKFKPGSMVCVTTIHSAMENIDKFDAILVDEFHHSAAESYSSTLFMAISAKYFYGFTACSTRADGMSLGIHAACGPIVYEKDTKWAIANKFLVKPRVVVVEVGGIGNWKKDLPHVNVYKYALRNQKLVQVILGLIQQSLDKGRKTMVLFKTVKGGEEVGKGAKKAAFPWKVEIASSQYRNPLRLFRNGDSKLLVSNAALCGEGVDIPDCDAVINCCQGSSENLVRQILGRGLRLSDGKKGMLYIDVVFSGYEPFMYAAQSRLKIYKTIVDDVQFIRL